LPAHCRCQKRTSDNGTHAVTEIPSLNNPLSAKGAGKSGTLCAPPALINAVLDALRLLVAGQIDMPATPSQV
jgi:carbon-monoxide dehydrogenase large subunit